MIVTDLNNRERERYADQLHAVSAAASQLARDLRAGDDTRALVQLALLGISGSGLHELTEIFLKATKVSVPDGPPAP